MKSAYLLGAILTAAIGLYTSHAYAGCEDRGGREADCHVTAIYPDCVDNFRPRMCTVVVAKVKGELQDLHQAFFTLNANQILSFFDPQALIYTFDQFFRGRNAFRDGSLLPTIAVSKSIDVNFSPFRFNVVSENVVATYGDLTTKITFLDNSTTTVVVRQIVTWVRQSPSVLSRTFTINTEYDQTL